VEAIIVIEIDEDGKEWFGYSFGSEETDYAVVISVFLGNVQYLEWFFRQIVDKSKQQTLAWQLHYIFDLLPNELERTITDDRSCLIHDIVRTRNRYAHGKFEEATPAINRVHTLSLKVAALLDFAERVSTKHPHETLLMTGYGSPYLLEKLGQSDADNGRVAQVSISKFSH
jgi:hypothetical protein